MGIRLPLYRLEEIKNTVVELFEHYNVSCVPISAFEIATKMGVAVMPYASKDEEMQSLMLKLSEDGFVRIQNGKAVIYYNDRKNYPRINNTLMHEIGHIVLDHSQDSELAEKEVKFFAKYALAPPVLIHKLGLKDAYAIAQAFDISFEAAGYALAYYHKWLRFGDRNYTQYELRMLELFKEAV